MREKKQGKPNWNISLEGIGSRVNGWCHRVVRIRDLALFAALAIIWGVASATDPQPPPDLNVTETTTLDALDAANMAPGVSDTAVGGGAAISSFNGNLQVGAPLSTVLPQDGKLPSLAFGLTYNSNNVRQYSVQEGSNSLPYLSGRSWVGLGWTGHMGRIFRLAKYHAASNNYSEFATYFEFPNGSLYQFEPEVWNANPDLKIAYFRDCPPPGVPPDPPPLCSSNICQRTPPPVCCEDAGGDPVDLCANRGDDRTEHYDVRFPSGTLYRLEKIVPYDYAPSGWVRNHDRAGYYTTAITDRFGNSITIDYARSGPFPEAITAVRSTQHHEMDLTTTRCVASDPDPSRCPAGTEGMLKDVVSVSFQGSRSEPQHMKAQLSYGIQTFVDAGQSVPVPVLTDITLVGSNQPQEVGGTTHFKFGVHHEPFLLTHWWGLKQIRTPLGAVIEFEYSTWRSGSRLIGSYTGDREIMGVVRQTTFPEGLGINDSPIGRPFFARNWNRDFAATSCSPAQDGANLFEQIAPDGRRTTFTVQGDVCGRPSITDKGPFGVADTVVAYQGNPGVALRTQANVYDFETDTDGNIVRQIPKNTESNFNDDQYTCFETPGPSDTPVTKKIVTAGSTRQFGRWQDTQLSSPYYMPAPNNLTVTRNGHKKLGNAPPCADGKVYVRGLTLASATEEGPGLTRFEENATWSCNGELLQSRTKDEWTPAGSANNQGLDADDLLRSFSYFPNGNLQQRVSSGRALYPDNTTSANSYTTTSSWLNAQVATQESPAVTAYKLADATPDIGGQIWKRRDANGLETAFDYDALGRLTEVDPPGSVEQKTRTIYDSDLRHVRLITSGGTETAFDPNQPDQLFAEQEVDQLGRVVQVWKAMPDGTKSTRVSRYDQFNRPIFVSEWLTEQQATSDLRSWSSDVDGDGIPEYVVSNVPYRADGGSARPWGTTTIYGTPSAAEPLNPLRAVPDGLGRVRRVERADGSVTEFAYCGPHVQTTVKRIQTGISGSATSDAVTRQYFDALGRLVLVDAPTGSADAEYVYDTRGNIVRVNLIEQLPPNPMDSWKQGAIPTGQVRTFKYDAAGRLVSRQTPEKGTELFGSVDGAGNVTDAYYDAKGNPLIYVDALGQQRGYFFKTVYDALGRRTYVQRVRGTPVAPNTLLYTSTLGVDGGFPSAGAWVEGTIAGNTFAHPVSDASYWRVVPSGAGTCRTNAPAPSSGLYPSSGSPLLYFGNPATCTYSDAPAASHAIRHAVTGVTRDDVLTFKYWRQVRQSATPKDLFQVYVVIPPAGAPDNVSSRRVAFKLDSAQTSFSRWQQAPEIRLGDLFTSGEWPEGATKSLDIYFVFDMLDTPQGNIGGGVAIDDVFVGRESWIEASYSYDYDVCEIAAPNGGEACNGGDELSNRYKGRLSEVRTYDGLRSLARQFFVYKGLNGRSSGENNLVDWAGDGVSDEWATRVGYTGQGNVAYWTAPYQGLTDPDDQRRYDYTYKRGLLDGLTANGTVFVQGGATPPNLAYTAAGSVSRVRFGNGAETDYAFDVMQRPESVTVKGPGQGTPTQQTLWSSGTYTYDGGSNIASIGAQRFAYDAAQRLIRAQVLPQATSSTETNPYDITSEYDPFGNMTSQQWQHGEGATPPPGFDFDLTYGTPSTVSNRVQGNGNFVYDPNGALLRAPGANGGQTAMLWDSQGRLSAFFNGTPEQQNRPTERYAYDAGGYRLIRWPESGDGRPVITLRSATGRTTTEFTADPTSQFPTLTRENVFLGGMQIAERLPVSSAPTLTANTTMYQNGTFGFKILGSVSGATYSVDIRTAEGFENHVGGVSPTSTGVFWIPESALISGQRNWVSVRREAASGEPYSNVVVVSYDTNLTPQDPNQVRAISVSRSGSKTFVKWNVLQENGKTLLVYFHQNGAEEPVLLTPQGLAPGATGYMILDQSMGSQCGHFNVTQATSSLTDETAPSANASLPPSGPLGAAVIFQVCDGDAPGSGGSGFPQPPTLLTNFHHRDHLGSLRVLTDVGGWKFDAHDYYPFGREIEAIQNDLNQGSVNRFTGHERDVRTGLDYMVMRSKSINYPFFVSPDLIDDVSLATPHSWNKYAYVRGRPIGAIDPMGLEWQLVCTGSDAWCDTPASGYFWGIGDGGGGYHPGPCVTEWVNGDPKQVCGDSIAYITTVNLPNSNDVQQSGPGMGIPGTRVQIAEKVLACLDAIISASPTGVAAREVMQRPFCNFA